MSIRLKKIQICPRTIIYMILILCVVGNALNAELNFPHFIWYFNDLCCIYLLFYIMIYDFPIKMFRKGMAITLGILSLYIIIIIFSSLLHPVPIHLFLWALRNNFRFFVFFIACICFLKISDINKLFDIFYKLQLVSFLLACYQFFILDYKMDMLGGIFGHGNGQGLNTFQAMLITYYLCEYLNKKVSFVRVAIVASTSVIIAAMAEEKAFFIYFAVLAAGCVILNRVRFRTIMIIAGTIFIITWGIKLLGTYNESWNLKVFSNFSELVSYADRSYALSRFNPFPEIRERFFGGDISKNLFGLGFGNCEYSEGSKFFMSKFAQQYQQLKYYIFTHQMKFLETGILGFGAYLAFFISLIILYIRFRILSRDKWLYNFGIVFTIITVISIWIAGALLVKEAYLIYFGIAVGGVYYKNSVS